MRTRAWPATLLLPLLLASGAAAAAVCESEVERRLRELGVPQTEIESVQIERRQFSPNPPTNYVYNAWVRLSSCGQGYLVINMTRYCLVKQSYTRGDCEVSGVPRY